MRTLEVGNCQPLFIFTDNLKMLLTGFIRQIVLSAGLALLVVGHVSAEDYSEGMRAYMAGDYELAQRHWLRAAERKDSKSMFNLGFLHEQRLIRGANANKAENWYRLAGQNGYPAAEYHLAQLLIAKQGGGPRAVVEQSYRRRK